MSESLHWRGGALVGAFNATWPFATLKATRETITLSVVLSGIYVFDHRNIQGLARHNGILTTGLQILHTEQKYPSFVVFWTLNFRKLKSELEALGFRVEDS